MTEEVLIPSYNGRNYRVTGTLPLPVPIDRYITLAQHCPYIIIVTNRPDEIIATLSKQRYPPVIPLDTTVTVPLSSGYPVVTRRYALIPHDIFTRTDRVIVESYYPRRQSLPVDLSEYRIPPRIYQTFETLVIPPVFTKCIESWRTVNPHCSYYYYTGVEAERFIGAHFEPRVLQAYRDLYPGAFKADLWRICQLYHRGGIYADIKMCAVDSFEPLLMEYDLILTVDINSSHIYNAFMGARKGHPFLKLVIDTIVTLVEKRSMGIVKPDALGITGPAMVGWCLRQYTGHSSFTKGSYYHPDGTCYLLLDHQFASIVNVDHRTVGDDEHCYLYTRHPQGTLSGVDCYYITGKPHYSHLFHQRRVYQ